MLTPERWQILKLLYDSASPLEPDQWEDFISRACSGDEEMAQSLRRLLLHSSITGSLLDTPVASLSPARETSSPGQKFLAGDLLDARFEIVRLLGRGGMGEVYEAFDRELQEHVAVKMVRQDAADASGMLQRLRAEVRRSRRIAHPNVCRVFDLFSHTLEDGSAVPFVTMQLLAGPTLAEVLRQHAPLQASQAGSLAVQMLSALAAAHAAGIIHRDFKPGNVILLGFGEENCRAVVTDFGLAIERLATFSAGADSCSVTITGTPEYMAPERFRGIATAGADVYAFGVVFYEMLTGLTPDTARTRQESGDSSPISPSALQRLRDVPERWRQVIQRSLRLDPQERFASADEVLNALNGGSSAERPRSAVTRRQSLVWLAGSAAALAAAAYAMRGRFYGISPEESLIVLPFRDTGNSSDAVLLGDGLTDGLINAMSRQKSLRVIAHGSTFHYAGRTVNERTLNAELNVTRVLSGTVLEEPPDRLRITLMLSTAPDGRRLWSKEYTGPVSSILALQHQIVADVGTLFKGAGEGGGSAPAQQLSNTDLEAYKLCLKGRYQWNLRNEEGFRNAIACFREAIAIAPNDERPYCSLADAYALLGFYGFAEPNDVMPAAKLAAQQALQIRQSLGEAHASLGLIGAVYDWNWDEAGASLRKSIDLDPGYVTGHHWYAFYLAWTGQAQAARDQMMKAAVLDPLSLVIPTNQGWMAFWARNYRQAEALLRHVMALNPDHSAAVVPLALACAHQSRFPEALEIITAGGRDKVAQNVLPDLARIYALSGQRAEALRAIAEAEPSSKDRYAAGVTMATAYEALHDRDKAFEWLFASYERRLSQMTFLKVDPRFDGLRQDPRFTDLLRKLHFRG